MTHGCQTAPHSWYESSLGEVSRLNKSEVALLDARSGAERRAVLLAAHRAMAIARRDQRTADFKLDAAAQAASPTGRRTSKSAFDHQRRAERSTPSQPSSANSINLVRPGLDLLAQRACDAHENPRGRGARSERLLRYRSRGALSRKQWWWDKYGPRGTAILR